MAVYCSSSDAVDDIYYRAAEELGKEMCRYGYDLVFGGSRVGLMGRLARSVKDGGGHVTGVIPEFIRDKGIAFEDADELIVTASMRERKSFIEERSDVFVAMPGGFGTLDEVVEILTLKQLQIHTKPIVLLNLEGFYEPLNEFFESLYQKRFAKEGHRDFYFLANSCRDIFEFLNFYVPPVPQSKWFG